MNECIHGLTAGTCHTCKEPRKLYSERRAGKKTRQELIYHRRHLMKFSPHLATNDGNIWTEADDRVVETDRPMAEIAADLKRTINAVQVRRYKLRSSQ